DFAAEGSGGLFLGEKSACTATNYQRRHSDPAAAGEEPRKNIGVAQPTINDLRHEKTHREIERSFASLRMTALYCGAIRTGTSIHNSQERCRAHSAAASPESVRGSE